MKAEGVKGDDEPCELYRFLPLGSGNKVLLDRLRDTLKNHRLYCPLPEQLNDPFDCIVNLENGDTHHEADIQARVNTQAGVLSFSELNSNVLMWSHYANSHRGVCLQFNMKVWNKNNGRLCHLGKVGYSMDRPPAPLPNNIQSGTTTLERIAFTKHIDWEYEKEWRMICSFKNRCQLISNSLLIWLSRWRTMRHFTNRYQHFLEFPKPALTGVIFGLRMADNDRSVVTKIIQDADYDDSELTIYEAREDRTRFSVDIVRVPPSIA